MMQATTSFSTKLTKCSFGLALLTLISACDSTVEVPKEPTRTVRVATVTTGESILQRRFTGRVDAISTIDLSFQVSGKLVKLTATEGALVPKGEVIAELDQNDYRLAVQQAKAQFTLAQLDLTRKRNLLKSGSLPKAMLDQAETNFKLSCVALETAQRNLSYTRIIAPFDALISDRLIDNHANVGAHQAIVRVQELTELRVRINISENMVTLLRQTENLQAEAVFKNRPQQRFPLVYREHMTEAGSVAQTYEIIFGTGYKPNTQFMPEAFKQSQEIDGNYLYRHIIHPDLKSMAFIGRAATFSNSLTSHVASAWLANLLTGKFQLPSREAMLENIAEMKQWKRSFMPDISSRSTVVKLHMVHYLDELLKDMNINPWRKKSKLAEWFAHYGPSDYSEILSEVGKG